MRGDLIPRWRVERVMAEEWEGPVAHHTESGAERWASSPSELAREIHKGKAKTRGASKLMT